MVKFVHSASAARAFTGSDPGHGPSTAHQAMLRRCPTTQLEGPTTRIYNYALGGFGEKKKKKKRRLATDVSSGTNLKKKGDLFWRLSFNHPCLLTSVSYSLVLLCITSCSVGSSHNSFPFTNYLLGCIFSGPLALSPCPHGLSAVSQSQMLGIQDPRPPFPRHLKH